MSRLGFHSRVVDLIRRCVSSVSFQVLVNGNPGRPFTPKCGLSVRTGLSPYHFLFCAEALSSLLKQAERRNLIHGAQLCRTAPTISHLLFADDSIIFGRANMREISTVKQLLRDYENASGQMASLPKSDITFSKGVPNCLQQELVNELGVNRAAQHGKYLGIPSTIGRSKKEIFQMLVDRTRKKSKDWKRKFLSGAGKTVLIKSILQSIPTYLMSCFLLPEQICHQLNNTAARFFWGQKGEERRIHWRNWKKLCCKKEDGGMGFRDIHLFNQAMLAKQAWRLLSEPNSLLARSLKARYFPRCEFLQASKAYNPSFAWRSLLAGKKMLSEGVAWKIGDGARIRVGLDRWIPTETGRYTPARLDQTNETLLVRDLFSAEGDWDWNRIDSHIVPEDADRIGDFMCPIQMDTDRPFWQHEKCGIYSVKSGYHLATYLKERDQPSTSTHDSRIWKEVWKVDVIPKVKLFMWRVLSNALPTNHALKKRCIPIDPVCRRCGMEEETVEHVLRDCEWMRFLWCASVLRLEIREQDVALNIFDWIENFWNQSCPQSKSIFSTLMWASWYARNNLIFQGKNFSPVECMAMAHRALWRKEKCWLDNRATSSRFLDCPAGGMKVNCDAAVMVGEGLGVGVFATDEEGKERICSYKFFRGSFSVELGECIAVREGLVLARKKGWRKLVVETDCQYIHTKLSLSSRDECYLGKTMGEIKELASNQEAVGFSWVPREMNSIADQLAKFALANPYIPCFTGSVPDFVVF